MGKRTFRPRSTRALLFLSFFFLFCVSSGMRLWSIWRHNQMAVATINHLSTTTSCAVDEARLQWQGEPPFTLSPYLQAVVASALHTELSPPSLDEWERDPRLYYWFMAQTAVKNERYADSLGYLAAANAGSMLDAAGHFSATQACHVINWTIASEIGYRDPPDGIVQGMMNYEQWTQVEEAFSRLLRYDLHRADWRLPLAKAYIALGEIAVAEETLTPVLLYGTVDEVEVANKLLQSMP